MKNSNSSIQIYNAKNIGSLFLLAFLAYGFGRHFFESRTFSDKYIGALLIIMNSIIVLFIGVLLSRTLRKFNLMVGNIYLFVRMFEAIALVSIVLNFIPTIQFNYDYGYFLAMLALGIGSIPMCLNLYKHNIAPNWLAIWGMIGYSIFAFGFLMELFGKQWSMYFLAPGGLWEIAFGIWLIIKGGNYEKTTHSS